MDVAPEKFAFEGGRRSPHRRLSPLWKAAATLFTILLLIGSPSLSAQTPAKADPVIYPRGSTAPDAPVQPAAGGSNSSLVLAAVLLLGAGGWWLWLKRRDGVRGLAGKASHLTIAETRSLGARQYLVVADYDGRKFLLGVCPGSIEMLTPLEGEKGKES